MHLESAMNVAQPGYQTHLIVDPQHKNMPAASFELPATWHASSVLKWVFQEGFIDPAGDFAYPVNVWALAENPANGDAMERFPDLSFYFVPQANMMGLGGLGGSLTGWFGSGATVGNGSGGLLGALAGLFGITPTSSRGQPAFRMVGATMSPPMSGVDAIAKFLLPRHRGGVTDLRIVGRFVPHDLGHIVQALPRNMKAEPVGLRIEYSMNGIAFEEEICAIRTEWVTSDTGPMGVMVQQNWQLASPFGIRAVRGTLQAKRPLFSRILQSSRQNPEWLRLFQSVYQQLQQQFNGLIQQGYDSIAAAGMASRAISANNDAMLASMEASRAAENAAWQQQRELARQESERHSTQDAWSDYFKGTNTYDDRSTATGTSEHSNEWSYVWSNGNGDYRRTNDANYNPNTDPSIGSAQNWELLRQGRSPT